MFSPPCFSLSFLILSNSGIEIFLSLFSQNKHKKLQHLNSNNNKNIRNTNQSIILTTTINTLSHYNPWPLLFSSLAQFLALPPSHSLPSRPHLTPSLRLFSAPLTGDQDAPRWSHAPAQTPAASPLQLRFLFLSSLLPSSLPSELARSSTKITTKR